MLFLLSRPDDCRYKWRRCYSVALVFWCSGVLVSIFAGDVGVVDDVGVRFVGAV